MFTIHSQQVYKKSEPVRTPGLLTWHYKGQVLLHPPASILTPVSASSYLHTRERRSVGKFPWSTSCVGMLQPMLCRGKWKNPLHRLHLLRFIWDALPHQRNKAKYQGARPRSSSSLSTPPSPELNQPSLCWCPLGCGEPDDLHHILVECRDPDMRSLRLRAFANIIPRLNELEPRHQYIVRYLKIILRSLRTPDPSRLSHAVMLGRPFRSTLLAWEQSMGPSSFHRSQLGCFKPFLLDLLVSLLTLSQDLWYLRCKLAHSKDPPSLPPSSPMDDSSSVLSTDLEMDLWTFSADLRVPSPRMSQIYSADSSPSSSSDSDLDSTADILDPSQRSDPRSHPAFSSTCWFPSVAVSDWSLGFDLDTSASDQADMSDSRLDQELILAGSL